MLLVLQWLLFESSFFHEEISLYIRPLGDRWDNPPIVTNDHRQISEISG